MPTSITRAPWRFAAWTIAARLDFICATGSPRRPSFAPSSTITIAGWVEASTRPIRAAPPAEQGHPARALGNAVGRGETVPVHQDGLGGRGSAASEQGAKQYRSHA